MKQVEMKSEPKNVLLTSAGRRGLLVQLFQRELGGLFPTAGVFATDLRPEISSACRLADRSFPVLPIADRGYVDELLDLCVEHEVGLVVPTIDTELMLLAEHRARFLEHGIHVAVSELDFVRQCRDKRLTSRLFSEHGIDSPRVVEPTKDAPYPLFAKPYDGSSSNNLFVLNSYEDVTPMIVDDPKMVCYEYLSPCEHDEYTVDMYYDRNSELRCFVPRLRIETRAGEVSKGRTARIASLEMLRENFGRLEGARGCLAVQFFVRRSSGDVFGIEINPRFGGGYPLSYEAGANYPQWLIREYLRDETVDHFEGWEDGLTMLRYDHHVLVRSAS